MLGRKLVQRLTHANRLAGEDISRVVLADVVEPLAPTSPTLRIETEVCDVAEPGVARGLVASLPEVIFDLAAVVSGEAEVDFEKGYRVNLEGTRLLLEAIRATG